MKIAITDANIFIDLFFLDIVEYLFAIECEIYTTRNVILELEDHHADQLNHHIESKKIKLETLTEIDKLNMKKLRLKRGLSETDISVIVVADRLDATVLTGDGLVRKMCHTKKIDVHGILWCLDQFVLKNKIVKSEACALLQNLMNYNKRLPYNDCKLYIVDKWGGSIN